MWHADLGMSTFDIWEHEEREKRLAIYRRKKQLENVVNGLANLLRKRAMLNEDDRAREDMIDEGGPVIELSESHPRKPYTWALELDRRHRATSMFLGLDPLNMSCDPPNIPPESPPQLEIPLTEEDKVYSDAVNSQILGKETL